MGISTVRRPGLRLPGLLVAVATLATACVGVTSRSDFQEIIESRGGGITSELLTSSLDAVGDRIGTDDFEIRSLNMNGGDNPVVSLEVRDPLSPELIDRYTVQGGGRVSSVDPVVVSADEQLGGHFFTVSELSGLGSLDGMVDAALGEFGMPDGFVASVHVDRPAEGGEIMVRAALESDRATGDAHFTADGDLTEVVRG